MNTKTAMLTTSLLAALGAGCGGELVDEPGVRVGDEGPVEAKTGAITATGCAAIQVIGEDHLGGILGYYSKQKDMYVTQLKYRVANYSSTPCKSVKYDWLLANDTTGQGIYTASLLTDLPANWWRDVWWTLSFDSRTYQPKVDYYEDAYFYRNGNLAKATYLPLYFQQTGQY